MKKVLSEDYRIFARAAGKNIFWKVSLKQTSDISETHTEGTWVVVTDRIKYDIADTNEKVEAAFAQFSSNNFKLVGLGIQWWKTNWFAAAETAAKLIECKVEFIVNNLTSDSLTMFGGWVDEVKGKFKATSTATKDTIEFTIYSYLDLAQRKSAETLLTQMYHSDFDGVMLHNIRGVYICNTYNTDPNYKLKRGVHTLTFDPVSGIKLDGGRFVVRNPLVDPQTLGDAELEEDDTQRIDVHLDAEFLDYEQASTQEIIVPDYTTEYPYTWCQRMLVYQVLQELLSKVGITEINIDEFKLNSYDGRDVTSLFEIPFGTTYYKQVSALAFEATGQKLYVALCDKIYIRDMDLHSYELFCQVLFESNPGFIITKLWLDYLNDGYIYGIGHYIGGNCYAFKIATSNKAVSIEEMTLRGDGQNNTNYKQDNVTICKPVDPGADQPSLIYAKSDSQSILLFSFEDMAESEILVEPITVGYLSFWRATNSSVYYTYSNGLRRVYYDEEWLAEYLDAVSGGIKLGVYNPNEDVLIFKKVTGSGIFSMNMSTQVVTEVTSNDGDQFSYDPTTHKVTCLVTIDGVVHFATIASNTLTDRSAIRFQKNADLVPWQYGKGYCYDNVNDRFIGVMWFSEVLFQHADYLSMYIEKEASQSGINVLDAIKELCIGFNLSLKIGADKVATIKRRADDSGNLVCNTATLELDVSIVKEITEATAINQSYDAVIFKNESSERSYGVDGVDHLTFGDEYSTTVNNKFVPDDLLIDYAYYFYQYFKLIFDLLTVDTPTVPLGEYEPYDAGDVDMTGLITFPIDVSGIITESKMVRDASTQHKIMTVHV